ncbi:hypothetical protein [Streptomyces sp. MZ04]|uniref:hypothetical protein n=1 Tax=Streptomyces sp. MZ04 TaxID=2559236 RepID=UPI00107E9729|nr:hypothetical protein [Streptomyces sp. MZ04]TGB06520.1 hypothetical protein E2651_23185 [Streptomyces sp. MZ04]
MPDTEAGLRAEIASLKAQLAEQTTIPPLPDQHDGESITWEAWEAAPVIIAHVLNGCEQCDHPGPILLNFGLAGPGRPTKRFRAFRCRSCQEMTVYRVQPRRNGPPGMDYIQFAYYPPHSVAN